MRAATRLTSKGQVVIPKVVRDRVRWRPGTRLDVEALPDGAVRLAAVNEDPIERLFGCLTEGDALADLEAEHRAEVTADARWRRRR
jgi:AbrB family looped-hinge helix DNA binding protein